MSKSPPKLKMRRTATGHNQNYDIRFLQMREVKLIRGLHKGAMEGLFIAVAPLPAVGLPQAITIRGCGKPVIEHIEAFVTKRFCDFKDLRIF